MGLARQTCGGTVIMKQFWERNLLARVTVWGESVDQPRYEAMGRRILPVLGKISSCNSC